MALVACLPASLLLWVAWFGPGGLCGPTWAGPWQCARLTDPPTQLGGCCTDPAAGATAGTATEWTHGGTQSGAAGRDEQRVERETADNLGGRV